MFGDLEQVKWARRLKIRHLEIFLLLIQSGSITAAATQLHLTQPAVSHWLSDLEDVIGAPLFIRGRRLKLSPVGLVFKSYAERTIGDVIRINEELDSVKLGAKGRIHVGTIIATAAVFLPAAIKKMHEEFPNIIITISEATFDVLIEKMQKKEVDFILGPLDLRASKTLFSNALLLSDEAVVVANTQHILNTRKITWDDTLPYPWILPPPGSMIRAAFEQTMLREKMPIPLPAIETAAMISQQSFLQQSDYLGLLTKSMARYYESIGLVKILPLKLARAHMSVGVLWDGESLEDPTRRFIDILKENASSISESIKK